MISRGYATDTQSKSSDIAATVLAASSPLQILAACDTVESFLHKHTAEQTRWFFSITFPILICKIFGFDECSSASAAVKSMSPSGWIDIAALSNDTQLAGDNNINLICRTDGPHKKCGGGLPCSGCQRFESAYLGYCIPFKTSWII